MKESILPKEHHVKNTAELLEKAKQEKEPYEIEVLGYKFIVLPEVFSPKYFFSSTWFAEQVSQMVKDEKEFLEMGCGTGVICCVVALRNEKIVVSASDINPKASENADLNSHKHKLEDRLSVYNGDVFDGIPGDKKYDSIFWAMPFGYIEPGKEMDHYETSVFDPGYRAIGKFMKEAKERLNPGGRVLIGFSDDIGHYDLLEDLAKENGFTLQLLTEEKGVEEKNTVGMQIYEARVIE